MERKPEDVEELNNLLIVLRRHGVSEYETDDSGVVIKFAPDPTPEAAVKVLTREIERATETPAPIRTEPDGPPPGVVEPMPFDLDEVLHGAK